MLLSRWFHSTTVLQKKESRSWHAVVSGLRYSSGNSYQGFIKLSSLLCSALTCLHNMAFTVARVFFVFVFFVFCFCVFERFSLFVQI